MSKIFESNISYSLIYIFIVKLHNFLIRAVISNTNLLMSEPQLQSQIHIVSDSLIMKFDSTEAQINY